MIKGIKTRRSAAAVWPSAASAGDGPLRRPIKLFGGEGLFYAVLKGPGRIWMQTTPFSRFADRIMDAAGGNKGQVKRGGNLIGSLLGGE